MAREFQDNPNLLKEFEEGEKIVWKAMAEEFPLVSPENKKSLFSRWLGCIAVAIIMAALYISAAANYEQGVSIMLLLLLLVAVAFVAILPVIDRNKIVKKSKYYITNRRAILHFDDKEIISLPIAGLKHEIVSAEEGGVHVELGSCVGIKPNKRRVAAFIPKKGANDAVNGIVFYNVADCEELRAALKN